MAGTRDRLLEADLVAILRDNSIKDMMNIFETSEKHVLNALKDQMNSEESIEKQTCFLDAKDTSIGAMAELKESEMYKHIMDKKQKTVGDIH